MGNLLKNKNALIIAAVVVFVFLLALIPILINVVSDKNEGAMNNPDTGLRLSGTYAISDGSVSYAGTSEYTFDGDKVTNVYVAGGEKVTVEYTYVIAVENGVDVIKLTTVSEDGTSKTTTHEFSTGKFGETPIIMINGQIYKLKEAE